MATLALRRSGSATEYLGRALDPSARTACSGAPRRSGTSFIRSPASDPRAGMRHGRFTRQLVRRLAGENPITAVTFDPAAVDGGDLPERWRSSRRGVAAQAARRTALRLRRRDRSARRRRTARRLLAAGPRAAQAGRPGRLLREQSLESGPQAPPARSAGSRERTIRAQLLSRPALYELISELGFIRVFAVFNDFVYCAAHARASAGCCATCRSLLENAPGIRTLAGSILLHAQKPPRHRRSVPCRSSSTRSLRGAVSVVVPCHNEEMNVGPLVTGFGSCTATISTRSFWSTTTAAMAPRAVIRPLRPRIRSIKPVFRRRPTASDARIADGYRAATGRWVLSMDCDFQHLLPEIRDLFDAAAAGLRRGRRQPVFAAQRAAELSVSEDRRQPRLPRHRARCCCVAAVPRPDEQPEADARARSSSELQLRRAGLRRERRDGLQPLLMGIA